MSKEEHLRRIHSVIASHMGVTEEQAAAPGFQLKNDSLDKLEILMSIEDEFSVEIPDDEASRWKSAEDIYLSVLKHDEECF